jgi:hypothetical protein
MTGVRALDPWNEYQRAYSRLAGRWLPMQSWHRVVSRDSVRNFIRGTGEANGQWLQEPCEAPPGYLYAFHPDDEWNVVPEGLGTLLALEEWNWYLPLVCDMSIEARTEHAPLVTKPSSRFGEAMDQIARTVFVNEASGKILAERRKLVKVFRRGPGTEAQGDLVPPWHYDDATAAAIDETYAHERVTWPEKLRLEDLSVGDTLGPIVRGPMTVTDVIAWVAAAGEPQIRAGYAKWAYLRRWPHLAAPDTAMNIPDVRARFHWDSAFAHGWVGSPAFDFVSQRTAWVSQLVTNWMGREARLTKLDVRALRPLYLGDTLWIRGTIQSIDEGSVKVAIDATNQAGASTTAASAIVTFGTGDRSPGRAPWLIDQMGN